MRYNHFNAKVYELSLNYSIPVYVHTQNSMIKIVELLENGVKGILTDEVSYSLLEVYLSKLKKFILE